MKKVACMFLFAALSIASAKTYSFTLHEKSVVAGTELRAGDYKVELDGDKMTIKNRQASVTAPVKVEQVDSKYGANTVRYSTADGKRIVNEMRLGGTNLKLVLDNAAGSVAPAAEAAAK